MINTINRIQNEYTQVDGDEKKVYEQALHHLHGDAVYDKIEATNWTAEMKYHNTYYNKGNYGPRELKMNNKKYLELYHDRTS